MPKRKHEIWLELIRTRPVVAADLLRYVRPALVPPFTEARLESGDLSEHKPASYAADAVVTLGKPKPRLAVIIEVQLRADARKHWSWPAYVATARKRLGCPTVLLVISPDPKVARWAGRPIPLGHPGMVLTPLVLGPAEVPVVPDVHPEVAAPELAVVSAAIHGAGPEGPKAFAALLDQVDDIEPERAKAYIDEVLAVLPKVARQRLEEMMATGTREYKSDFARRYVAEGRAEGARRSILAILSAREIGVPDDARARLDECSDLDQLEVWVRRAATADSIEDLFESH